MAVGWYQCKVLRTGCGDFGFFADIVEVGVANGFASRWATLLESCKREQLAVALAAMTNGLNVNVMIDLAVSDPRTGFSVVQRLYAIGR